MHHKPMRETIKLSNENFYMLMSWQGTAWKDNHPEKLNDIVWRARTLAK